MNSKRSISHRRTNSAPGGLGKSRSCDSSTNDFYELVSAHTTRPPVNEDYSHIYDRKSVLRISSWNLQNFIVEKAKNPGVREVTCRTILENGFSLLAVQEVASREALSLIASELNEPKLYHVQNWERERGKWHSLTPPPPKNSDTSVKKTLMNGFLYDTSHGLQLRDSTVLYLPPEKLMGLTVTCQPFLGWFSVENLDFVVVTFSLVSESCVAKLLPSILELLKERIPSEKNVFLMGDFILPPGHTVFEVVSSQGYTHLIPVSSATNSFQQEESHLWASLNLRKLFTGRSGVVTEGLNHLAIPNGWKWGGLVSDHCPVWAEIFTEENLNAPSSMPLANGISKMPTMTSEVSSDSAEENICRFNEKSDKKCKGFWERSWTRNCNNKSNVTCAKNSAINKENGSL